MIVRIIKDWDTPNLLRQTPNNSGIWNNIKFTLEPIQECDYVIVLNYLLNNERVVCPSENVWVVMQEPYIPGVFDWMVEGHKQFSKVFTHHIPNKNTKYHASFPMLPWHVDKSYDQLISIPSSEKHKMLSWITSNKTIFPGHKVRMNFFEVLTKSDLNVDFFGRGINEINDKWDGLSHYKYSLAIENSQSEYYWTEKLSDCFLSFTMPIYYGATNIGTYFPKEAMIIIDISKPEEAINIIKEAIAGNAWEKNFDAILYARNKVLNSYNFFSVISECIFKDECHSISKEIILKKYKRSFKKKVINFFNKCYSSEIKKA